MFKSLLNELSALTSKDIMLCKKKKKSLFIIRCTDLLLYLCLLEKLLLHKSCSPLSTPNF